jgi:hypothetical protein
MLTGEARRLHVEKRILIQCIVRRSVLQPDLVETDLNSSASSIASEV